MNEEFVPSIYINEHDELTPLDKLPLGAFFICSRADGGAPNNYYQVTGRESTTPFITTLRYYKGTNPVESVFHNTTQLVIPLKSNIVLLKNKSS